MSEPRCPSCDSSTLSVERRPDGDARCAMCGWSGKYAMCFNDQKTEVRISSEPRRWNLVAEGLILAVSGGPSVSFQEAEKGIPVIEAEPVLERIKQLEAQLKEANEVAEFYAEVGEDASTTIEVLLELAMSQRGTDKKTINLGGKLIAQRARAYLKKWEGR